MYFIDQSQWVYLESVPGQSVSVGGGHKQSICPVSNSEEGEKWVMKEQIDQNIERQQDKKRRDQR